MIESPRRLWAVAATGNSGGTSFPRIGWRLSGGPRIRIHSIGLRSTSLDIRAPSCLWTNMTPRTDPMSTHSAPGRFPATSTRLSDSSRNRSMYQEPAFSVPRTVATITRPAGAMSAPPTTRAAALATVVKSVNNAASSPSSTGGAPPLTVLQLRMSKRTAAEAARPQGSTATHLTSCFHSGRLDVMQSTSRLSSPAGGRLRGPLWASRPEYRVAPLRHLFGRSVGANAHGLPATGGNHSYSQVHGIPV